jgi:hypothetical protein
MSVSTQQSTDGRDRPRRPWPAWTVAAATGVSLLSGLVQIVNALVGIDSFGTISAVTGGFLVTWLALGVGLVAAIVWARKEDNFRPLWLVSVLLLISCGAALVFLPKAPPLTTASLSDEGANTDAGVRYFGSSTSDFAPKMSLDLDSFSTDMLSRDLYLADRTLGLERGTGLALAGGLNANPTYAACEKLIQEQSKNSIDLDEFVNGATICVRTSEDRIAYAVIAKVELTNNNTINYLIMNWTVWRKPS